MKRRENGSTPVDGSSRNATWRFPMRAMPRESSRLLPPECGDLFGIRARHPSVGTTALVEVQFELKNFADAVDLVSDPAFRHAVR